MLEQIVKAIQWIVDFLSNEADKLLELLQNFGQWLIEKAVIAYLEAKLAMLKAAWEIGKAVVENFGVADKISTAISALPADLAAAVNLVGLPQGLSLILTAGATKLALRFMPGA